MNDLQIFENPEFGQVRTVELDGTPWLVGKDVAVALGYAKPQNAIARHVDTEDQKVAPIQGTPGGKKQAEHAAQARTTTAGRITEG